jgi:hypothetical protein
MFCMFVSLSRLNTRPTFEHEMQDRPDPSVPDHATAVARRPRSAQYRHLRT